MPLKKSDFYIALLITWPLEVVKTYSEGEFLVIKFEFGRSFCMSLEGDSDKIDTLRSNF
jgi:hypothetical protein